MRKILLCILTILSVIGLIVFLCLSFTPLGSVYVYEYKVNKDNDKMTIYVFNSASMGYIRSVDDNKTEVGVHILTFYPSWGGMNSKIGAMNEFEIELNPNDTEIQIYRGNGKYTTELIKDNECGDWIWN